MAKSWEEQEKKFEQEREQMRRRHDEDREALKHWQDEQRQFWQAFLAEFKRHNELLERVVNRGTDAL